MEFNPQLVDKEILQDLCKEQQVKYTIGFLNINVNKMNIARFKENESKEKLKENMEIIGKSKEAEIQAMKMEEINLEINLKNLNTLNEFISLK